MEWFGNWEPLEAHIYLSCIPRAWRPRLFHGLNTEGITSGLEMSWPHGGIKYSHLIASPPGFCLIRERNTTLTAGMVLNKSRHSRSRLLGGNPCFLVEEPHWAIVSLSVKRGQYIHTSFTDHREDEMRQKRQSPWHATESRSCKGVGSLFAVRIPFSPKPGIHFSSQSCSLGFS